MKSAQGKRSTRPRQRARKRALAARLDGLEQWPKTLQRLLWMLLRAGNEPEALTAQTASTLKTHRGLSPLRIPPPDVLEYARVLTYWRNEPVFLDEQGAPRSLALSGGRSSFTALVRQALPGVPLEEVVAVLRRHQLIGLTRSGRVTLRSAAFLPKNAQRAQFFAYTLAAVAGIIETCYRNLTAREPNDSIGRLQRVASAERFDMKYLKDYDLFLRDQASDFLLKQDAWLKRHEAKSPKRASARIAQVGVGVFGFRAG